jgi:predicted DsbA family dithiol-disulfide isomerase
MRDRFDATVEWLPFDLHPEYPPDGVPRNPERAARAAVLFASHGLSYNPPPVSPRSLDAQRLGEHARAQGLYGQYFERTMDAYWAEGRNIGDREVLLALADDVGVEGAGGVLASDRYADTVVRSTAEAHSIGINGIPGFLLDGRLLVLGAHPRETFERAFEQLRT